MEFLFHLAVQACIFAILALSLSIVAAACNQISLAHAAFYGVGAYVAAILELESGLPVIAIFSCSILLSAAMGLLMAALAHRTTDDYYIVITIAFQFLVYTCLLNWDNVTGGPNGLAGIPPITVFGLILDSRSEFFVLTSIILLLTFLMITNLFDSPLGKRLFLVGQDEVLAQAVGINVYYEKMVANAVSAGIAGLAGSLFAYYSSYIDPSSFALDVSILVLTLVILGGMKKPALVVLASVVLTILPEALRFIGMPDSISSHVRQLLYGSILILVVYLQARQRALRLQKSIVG